MIKVAVAVFPGTNCEKETYYVLKDLMGFDTSYLWYKERDLSPYSLVVLPGGFTYADYLRAGALARFSPVVKELYSYVEKEKGLVLGICNGFQILTEAAFLPGAFTINITRRFISRSVPLKIENNDTAFTRRFHKDEIIELPIAHREGRFFLDNEDLKKARRKNLILLRYHGENPNGSVDSIAAIMNEKGNVFGVMPHPERNSEPLLGSGEGIKFFLSLRDAIWS